MNSYINVIKIVNVCIHVYNDISRFHARLVVLLLSSKGILHVDDPVYTGKLNFNTGSLHSG